MSLRDPQTLDDLLNYRLVRLIAMTSAPVIRLCEGGYGISRREWRILALLAAHGALSPSALAERGDLDRARTSRAIGSLAKKKLVARVAEPGDRRRASVDLTAAGRRLYEALFPLVRDIHCRLISTLDDRTLSVLDDVLNRLTTHATQLNSEGVTGGPADRRPGSTGGGWHAPGDDD